MSPASPSRRVPMKCYSCQEPCGPERPWSILVGFPHQDVSPLKQLHPVGAHHHECRNPDEAMYPVPTPPSGEHTEHSLLRWSAQLSDKVWMPDSRWGQFLYAHLLEAPR